jgi:non-ribosomal peptide synthase protein (TIGR01720 family)
VAAGDVLKRIKEQRRAIPDNGAGHGLLRHLNPATRDELAGAPRPQFGFNYLGRFGGGSGSGEPRDWDSVPGGTGVVPDEDARMPLAHVVELNARTADGPDGPELVASWTFAGELVRREDVQVLADAWFAALTALRGHASECGAGGLTPSDLGLNSLSQDEIDEFEAEFEAEWGTRT